MNRQQDRARVFVSWLLERQNDRGVMAELRRSLGRDTEYRAWKHLARWCDLTRIDQRLAYGAVAGAFAAHPCNAETGNLGDTMRAIALGSAPDGGDPLASFEGRFRRLLTCDSVAELAERVGSVARAAKQREITINYCQLLQDLLDFRWPDAREHAKLRWAYAFWRADGAEGEG